MGESPLPQPQCNDKVRVKFFTAFFSTFEICYELFQELFCATVFSNTQSKLSIPLTWSFPGSPKLLKTNMLNNGEGLLLILFQTLQGWHWKFYKP